MIRHRFSGVLLALALGSPGALAAGSTSSTTESTPPTALDRAASAVEAADYRRALGLLEGIVGRDAGNADAWNYIGFSKRKLGDYDGALAAYRKALAIDPEHRGALEYLGELYLQMGDVASARRQLARLDSACTWGCEEFDELEAAIAKHEAD